MRQTYKFNISGKVQGVGYRRFVEKLAVKYHFSGWVKNLQDGSVEALIQANNDLFIYIEKELKTGPLFSKVIDIRKTKQEDNEITYSEFTIRKDG